MKKPPCIGDVLVSRLEGINKVNSKKKTKKIVVKNNPI